eukprot:1338166-Amorphochlora_amoeboformis.AAC.1
MLNNLILTLALTLAPILTIQPNPNPNPILESFSIALRDQILDGLRNFSSYNPITNSNPNPEPPPNAIPYPGY